MKFIVKGRVEDPDLRVVHLEVNDGDLELYFDGKMVLFICDRGVLYRIENPGVPGLTLDEGGNIKLSCA